MPPVFVLKEFAALSLQELYAIMRLRQEVFIVEQNCPYLDADGKDLSSLHLMCYEQEAIAAYVRLLPKGVSYENYVSIGRVVSGMAYRGKGYGRAIMKEALRVANKKWTNAPIKISAQVYLTRFYESLGFRVEGEIYLEDDIPHIAMVFDSNTVF
jgi:ElaA protein